MKLTATLGVFSAGAVKGTSSGGSGMPLEVWGWAGGEVELWLFQMWVGEMEHQMWVVHENSLWLVGRYL